MAHCDKPLPSTPNEDDSSSDWQSYNTSEASVSIHIQDKPTVNNHISFATKWRSKFGTSKRRHSVILSDLVADRQDQHAPAAYTNTPLTLTPQSLSYPYEYHTQHALLCKSASAHFLHSTPVQHLDTASSRTAPPSPYDSDLYDADVHSHHQQTDKLPGIFLCPPPTVTGQLAYTVASYPYGPPDEATTMNPMASPNVSELLTALSSTEDPVRKLAVFKLQSLINDPSFAELFVTQGGLPKLRDLILVASGNTLAYSLASFARLLEVDQGWDGVDSRLIQKNVELIVSEPLVNILRGALSVLVAIVSRLGNQSQAQDDTTSKLKQKEKGKEYVGGFKALKPAIALHPQFLEMLVSRLSSADHSLCANALQLINALMRDAITKDDEHEWPKFIKRIQDLGVIKAVYILMQSSALQDLAAPLLDFQALTKVLLRRWRDVSVDLTKPEHRRTIKALHLSSNPERSFDFGRGTINQPKHNPYKWRRLGFTTESPEPDFEYMGFLGMMDLSDYVRKHQDEFQHILLEQAEAEAEQRCPIARASLFVTVVLFEHFEVDKTELEDTKNHLALESRTNFEAVFKPLLLHWSRLHVAGLHAFLRLWKATGAELQDFNKIEELIRILVESVVGGAERTKGIEQIEQEMAGFEISKLRELQMELLELTYEDIWGQHLRSIREELRAESLQFVKEQRIQCLLRGSWFPSDSEEFEQEHGGPVTDGGQASMQTWTYIKLSPDRKYLHFGNFQELYREPPSLGTLHDRIDLSVVSSVVSNVTASEDPNEIYASTDGGQQERYTTTKISIHGYARDTRSRTSQSRNSHRHTQSRASKRENQSQKEIILLTFQPENHRVASEWLDGLLMLLEQQPITAETNKLISVISDHGLKVRLLNVRFNDEEGLVEGMEAPPIPSRDGLDEDYFYEI